MTDTQRCPQCRGLKMTLDKSGKKLVPCPTCKGKGRVTKVAYRL